MLLVVISYASSLETIVCIIFNIQISLIVGTSIFALVDVRELDTILGTYQDREFIIQGFANGFKLGIEGTPSRTGGEKLLPVRAELRKKVDEEVAKGRLLGPFKHSPIEGLMISPLYVVPKPGSTKFRMIFNLSSPKGTSVNDCIPPEAKSVHYCTVFDAAMWIMENDRGTEETYLAKVDLTDAYRFVPLAKSEWEYMGMRVGEDIYIDRCLPMGASSSCQLFQRISNAIAWAFEHTFKGTCRIFNYLDDFLLISPGKEECQRALVHFMSICKKLKIPLSAEKTLHPSQSLIFLGIGMNTLKMSLFIPQDKLDKSLVLLDTFLKQANPKVLTWQRVIGVLCHLSQVVSSGRTFLGSLHGSLQGILSQDQQRRRRINKEVREDLAVWKLFLQQSPPSRQFMVLNGSFETNLVFDTDASSSIGYGCVFGRRWFWGYWQGSQGNLNIAILELYPIHVAMHLWVEEFKDKVVLVRTDNQALVSVINRLYSKDVGIRKLLKPITLLCMTNNIQLKAVHIAGADNTGPDLLSRGRVDTFLTTFRDVEQHPTLVPQFLLPGIIMAASSTH